MTTPASSLPVPALSSATARVPLVLSLLFWPAAVALVILSPSVVDDLIGVPALFAFYLLMLGGYILLVAVRDRPADQAPRRWHPIASRSVYSEPAPVSG